MGNDKETPKPNNDKGEFKGERPGPELANGPINDRSCRDILCCLVFLAFWCGFLGVTIWGLTNGNPEMLGRGYDSEGKICGISTGYEDYPYLYFPVPATDYLTKTLCVKTCPGNSTTITSIECKTNTIFTDCVIDKTSSADLALIVSGSTTWTPGDIYQYDTSGYLSRYCLPSALNSVSLTDVTDQVMSSDTMENWISDLRTCWGIIAGCAGIAFLLGFVYMFFVRYCAGVLTWISIFGVIVLLAVLGALLYTGASSTSALVTAYQSGKISTVATSSSDSQKIMGYICWGLSGFVLLMTLCLCSRIKLAIAILKAAADFVKSTPTVFLVPPVMLICLLAFYAYSGITAIYLFSAGNMTQISGYPIGTYSYSTQQKWLILYTIFGILWGNAFINAAAQFIIASTACIWYFAQPEGKAHSPVRTSVKRLFRYHLGSIAFGSCILAVIQAIRLILAYIQKQAEANKAKDNKCIKFMLTCAQCYVACFERCIKFLNKNAYIQIALKGKGFCGAAKDAFFLILNNPIRFGVTHSIGGIFILFGKFLVSAGASLVGYLVIHNSSYYQSVTSPVFPVIVIFILSWGISAVFLGVYAMAGDTVLACFVVEEEIRKKDSSSVLHCPKSLESFINANASNKATAKVDNKPTEQPEKKK